jgi:DNA polymerase I-like protein with 3'-5' exonuclease and polymerase domains
MAPEDDGQFSVQDPLIPEEDEDEDDEDEDGGDDEGGPEEDEDDEDEDGGDDEGGPEEDEVVDPEVALETPEEAPPAKKRRSRRKLADGEEALTCQDLVLPKKAKKKKEAEPVKSPRNIFDEMMANLDINTLIEPWMHSKAFQLIHTVEELEAWAQEVVTDKSRWRIGGDGTLMPIIAVDTETDGLDTRIVCGVPQIRSAGICLSSSGVDGLYVPLCHESTANLPIREVQRILQKLFNVSHLVFFNGKYDREVLRNTMGITLRGWPFYEDVQVLKYLVDPKSDAARTYTGDGGNTLKDLSWRELGFKQIRLEELTKIRVKMWSNKAQKMTLQVVHVPFYWVPGDVAVWYAAGDAICTWLLWDIYHEEARKLKLVHKIDHKLIDTLCWIERQRYLIDVPALKKLVVWHGQQVAEIKAKLTAMADMGKEFNPGSTAQLSALLFDKWGFVPYKKSEATGKPSTDEESLKELRKQKLNNDYNDIGHEFLNTLLSLREYAALHPENLSFDPRDHSARMFLRQTVVAGGRLAASGGESFDTDGGFGLNIQAIKSVGGNQWVQGRRLRLEEVEDKLVEHYGSATFSEEDIEPLAIENMHPSCIKKGKMEVDGTVKNRVIKVFGEWYSLAAHDDVVRLHWGDEHLDIPLEPWKKIDVKQVVNLRSLFIAPEGWTFYTVDYSNIEMRVAANVSKEEKFIHEFNHGTGDFHSLTAGLVFPEFNTLDPLKDKDRRKVLRSIAKILNFALLYGGTGYTIYENMKKENPTITREETDDMVAKYWEGVPTFFAWTESKKLIARERFLVKTATGRVVKFQSAMESHKIHKPSDEELANLRAYYDFSRAGENAKASGDPERAAYYIKKARALMADDESGVRNAQEYRRFLGKIERVAMNIPLQGLAGDLMRLAMTRIYEWAIEEPGLAHVLQLHGSVHDELDFSVKNEFAPYVLPRIVRIMKLRDVHEKMGWPVPIETDCEYGRSWDVKEHLTGDDGHPPAGWTRLPGLESYIPAEFGADMSIPDKAVRICATGNVQKIDALMDALKAMTNPRVHFIFDDVKAIALGDEDKGEISDIRRRIIAALQLHEYWTIDSASAEGDETLSEYADRMGLDLAPTRMKPLEANPDIVDYLPALKNEWLVREGTVNPPPTALACMSGDGDDDPPPPPKSFDRELEAKEALPISTQPYESHPAGEHEAVDEGVDDAVKEAVVVDVSTPGKPSVECAVLAPPNDPLHFDRDGLAYQKYPEIAPWVHPVQIQRLAAMSVLGLNTITFIYRGDIHELKNVSLEAIPPELLLPKEPPARA